MTDVEQIKELELMLEAAEAELENLGRQVVNLSMQWRVARKKLEASRAEG